MNEVGSLTVFRTHEKEVAMIINYNSRKCNGEEKVNVTKYFKVACENTPYLLWDGESKGKSQMEKRRVLVA